MSIKGGVGAGGAGAINGPGGILFIGPTRDPGSGLGGGTVQPGPVIPGSQEPVVPHVPPLPGEAGGPPGPPAPDPNVPPVTMPKWLLPKAGGTPSG